MIGIGQLFQIAVGFLGAVMAVGTFWLGDYFDWDLSTQVSVAIGIAVITVLIELITAYRALANAIKRLYPALDFSSREQRQLFSIIEDINALKRDTQNPTARIALAIYDRAAETLNKARQSNDFQIDNMFEANLLALNMLRPGQSFLGISAILNPDHWNYDPHLRQYRDANYRQAAAGVIVRRIFLLKDEAELEIMRPIIADQAANGIDVAYAMVPDITGFSYYPDFTILPDLDFGLYVPKLEKLLTVVATRNADIIADMRSDFERIRARARRLDS